MKQKISFLLSVLYCTACINTQNKTVPITYYSNSYQIYQEFKDRPDLMVQAYKNNQHLWENTPKVRLYYAKALSKIGEYQQSIFVADMLLSHKLSYFQQGDLYFLLAQNHQYTDDTNRARFFYDKTLYYKNYYYLYQYGKFEYFEKNYEKSLSLHQQALEQKPQPYICRSYIKVLDKLLIQTKGSDRYAEIHQLAETNSYFSKNRLHIIDKAIILRNPFSK